jgi:hypothetical protein
MKNKVIKILIATIFLIVIIFLLLRIKGTNKQFRNVVLSEKNLISNFVNPSYYDTILMVGLDLMKIENQSVVIRKLSESTKGQFDGELQAHLKYHEGVFYLFMNEHDRGESIKILAHEIVHIQQYSSGDLKYEKGLITWMGNTTELNSQPYEMRPWENDAFDRARALSNNIESVLVENN